MKATSALLLALAHIGLANATNFCASQPKSCANLPQSSGKACSSLICTLRLQPKDLFYLLTRLKLNPVYN